MALRHLFLHRHVLYNVHSINGIPLKWEIKTTINRLNDILISTVHTHLLKVQNILTYMFKPSNALVSCLMECLFGVKAE